MNAEDLYAQREDLMTIEEREEWNHEPSEESIPTLTPKIRSWILNIDRVTPEAESKKQFLKRKPAMGASASLLQEIRQHHPKLPPVQQRQLMKHIRSHMLRQLIPCPNAATIDELVDILQAEVDTGIPSGVPEWYEFSNVRFGPRRIGYKCCGAPNCYQTETIDKSFGRCTNCKIVYYCSKPCQLNDWKMRHKQVCKQGNNDFHMMQKAAQALNMFADRHP